MPSGGSSRTGQVVLLNGPPSCGKTSLARALVDAADEPWFHRSLDDLRAGYLDRFWLTDDGTLFERTMRGYLAAVRAMARAGSVVVAEAVITTARTELFVETFREVPTILVGVHCPLDIAIARERNRTDRLRGPLELPPDAFAAVHAGVDYDLETNTSTHDPDALAVLLMPQLRSVAPRHGHPIRLARTR